MTDTRERPASRWRIIGGAAMALASLVVIYHLWLLCQVVWYNYRDPGMTPIMREQLTLLQAKNASAELHRQWADYGSINNHLKRAVVAAEDSDFVNHGGVEWDAIRKAWEYNQQQADSGSARRRGGSTITQQLAKNLFLSSSRSYVRKGQELVLAYMIEHVMSKQRILELYLNVAEWGVGVFGAQAAAQHYYQRPASQLSAAQAARLAAMLPNPRYYDQHRSTSYLNSRTAVLQRRMQQVSIP